jgi:hypothetical protein
MNDDRLIAKLVRERDNARRDRDAAIEEFHVYRSDKQVIDKALWLLAHDFLMMIIHPDKIPQCEKPKDNEAFMKAMESLVARALIAAKKDTHEWSSDEVRSEIHSTVNFFPPTETMH